MVVIHVALFPEMQIKLSKKLSLKDMTRFIKEKLQISDAEIKEKLQTPDIETVVAADSVKDEL